MTILHALKNWWHPSQETIENLIEHPSFAKDSTVIVIFSLIYTTIAELGLFNAIVLHFIAAYSLMFTIIWLVPSVVSMLLFRLSKRQFNVEVYLVINARSIFFVISLAFIGFIGFMIYSNFISVPQRAGYYAMIYYNQWYPLAVVGGIGAIMISQAVIHNTRRMIKAPMWQISAIWILSFLLALSGAYLFFRGWL